VNGPAAVNEDAVKLTSYFGERRRVAGDGFAADALLDLYGRHEVATSILLRGAEGFGAKRHQRTDMSLSLSEDLPLIAVAVDSRTRIEPLVARTAELTGTGLVTLERARLLRDDIEADDIDAVMLREGAHEETKLTIYLGRQERVYRMPAFMAVCDLLHRRGVAGATALLGVDGTAHGQRERASFFSRNSGTPMMVIAVGSGERIGRVLPELSGLLRRPLLTLERVRICKRDGRLLCPPGTVEPNTGETAAGQAGLPVWHKLMVYTSEAALHDGQPVHRAIVRRLRTAGISGATTQRGIWGFHGDHAPHGDRLLQLGRHVPAVTIVIDSPERIAAEFTIIDELTAEHGLVTSEIIPAMRPGGDGHGQYVLRR
jgi:PII-like signaling protein